MNEAFACRTPAVVSDAVGCGPDLVDEGRTGATFPLGDADALADAVERVAPHLGTDAVAGSALEEKVAYVLAGPRRPGDARGGRGRRGTAPARRGPRERACPTSPASRVLVMLGGIPLHGQERGNIQVFTALKDAGVEALFVTQQGVRARVDSAGPRRPRPAGGRSGRTPASSRAGWASASGAAASARSQAANWDFWRAGRAFRPTHVHVCNEGDVLALLPAVRALGVPVVFRLGDEPRQHRPLFRRIWRRAILPSVDQFVCISEFVRGKLLAAGADSSKIRVIHNAPPERPPDLEIGGTAGATRGDDALADVAAEPFEGRTVVYMGQLNERKGVDLLVEAALRLCRERPDIRFLVAGDYAWQNPFARGLMADVEAAGLRDRIRFLGYVNDVPGLLALADVHTAPSVWEEPLGNVAVEAKRGGRPQRRVPVRRAPRARR